MVVNEMDWRYRRTVQQRLIFSQRQGDEQKEWCQMMRYGTPLGLNPHTKDDVDNDNDYYAHQQPDSRRISTAQILHVS